MILKNQVMMKQRKLESHKQAVGNHGDAFVGGLDYSTCRDVLYNCFKDLQIQVSDLANLEISCQIKDKKELHNFKKFVDFLTKKSDESVENRKNKDEIIKSLHG